MATESRRWQIDRPVQDNVVAAAVDGGVVIAARHRIAEQLLTFGQAKRVELENLAVGVGRYLCFVEHRAPGDLAGIDGCACGRNCSRTVERMPSAPTNKSPRSRVPSVNRALTPALSCSTMQPLAETVGLRRQSVAERLVEPRPAAHGAHRPVEGDAGAAQDRDELRMRAEADAAAGQFFFIALEDAGVPAGAAKKMRGEESAQRSADNQRAPRVLDHGMAQDRLSCPGL